MNIRPKNNKILYADTGVKFSQNNLRGANWRQQVFNNYRQHLLDQLAKYGEARDYGDWLNEMQSRHANIYNLAGGENGNWENVAYKNDLVGQYQQDYRGGLGNDGQYKRFGTTQINPDDKYDFNQTGIKTNQSTRYNIANPPSRTSGDYSREGYNYKVDNLYSAITDDRRLLGRKGDWDENSEEYKQWQKDLNSKGWETYLDTKDNYYKLRRLAAEPDKPATSKEQEKQKEKINGIIGEEKVDKESLWQKLGQGFSKIAPDLLDTLRLAGNMINNQRVYDESMKAIKPNLQQSYHTYRQVTGDEATKQAYYKRAVQGEQRAARPFTSDADRQVAYMNEAKRIGDELRAQGDLADNQRIRETSAESSAHLDANRERDTAVANSNITEMNKADAAKHQLTAQKYSADWTNLEQYLMGRQYKLEKEKARQKELEDQLSLLDTKESLLGNTQLKEYRDLADKAYYDYLKYEGKDENEKASLKAKYEEAIKRYQLLNIQLTRENLKKQYGGIYSAKEGTKIEKKRKDDSLKYLYKTSRDVVEHFRKMSKMTDDSRTKTLPKPIKLPSHPKKFQYGGLAPFTIYRPLGVGGEEAYKQSVESGSSSKSSKDTAAKDKLDMIKELFKQVQGLPIDVSRVYQEISGVLNKAKAFGEELSTDDIASMYLNVMNRMSQLKYSQDAFEKAKALATSNEALNEIAVGVHGEMVLQDTDSGKVKIGTLQDWIKSDKKLNPLTNDQILELRAKSPNMVFNDDILGIVNNGVGINKVSAQIKSLAATIGSSTEKLEGISQVESNKIKAGLRILAGTSGTPDGYYKVSTDQKDSTENVKAALNYIYNMLPNNYRTLLEIHSDGKGKELIANFLNSQVSDYVKQDISPLTGKASDKEKDTTNDMLPSVAFFNGLGEKDSFVIQDKTGDGLRINTISTPITSKGYSTGSITLSKLESSDFGGQLLMNQATMGDSLISSIGRNNLIVDGRIYQAELPIDKEAKNQGIIKPDLKFLKNIEIADEKLRQMGIDKSDPKNIPTINKVYQENGLPVLYTISDNKPVITSEYARFAIVNGVGTEEAFGENPEFNDGVREITGEKERQQFETLMQQQSGNSKYKLDNGIGISALGLTFGETKLYQGTVYIPMVTSNLSALAGTGYKAKGSEYNEIEALQQAADAARQKGFKPAGNTLK